MVVIGVFGSEEQEELAIRLIGADSNQVYEEKDKNLLSMRVQDMNEALHIGRLLSDAGAEHAEIDAEAA